MIPLVLLLGCAPDPDLADSTVEEPLVEAGCDFGHGKEIGKVGPGFLSETSGLAPGLVNPGALWMHNDSGDNARLAALTPQGDLLGEVFLRGLVARDWEDMASCRIDGTAWLVVGDIGDNTNIRPSISLARVREPEVNGTDPLILDAEVLSLTWPEGPSDAEALMCDPATGDLYVVSKVMSGDTGVYRVPAPQPWGGDAVLEQVARLDFGSPPLEGSTLVTAGDISQDGTLVLLKTYTSAFAWSRASHQDVASALAGPPCPLDVVVEAQGESAAIAVDGSVYYTVSEGEHPPIYQYPRQ